MGGRSPPYRPPATHYERRFFFAGRFFGLSFSGFGGVFTAALRARRNRSFASFSLY